MPYYVYIILCKGGSFYTGCTKDLEMRMKLHMNGKGAKYTMMHKPKKIVYAEEFNSRAEAMRREKNIKRFHHHQKLKLINSQTRPKKTKNL